ncbi:O-methyltransferase [Salinibacterium sp. SWN167]|uniref:O-methyltransferase n=1 Tax=Salinibacterium sp. SWN167 TaxID=2792054 RepID=UPI0018CF7487|nr:O-methyltransferase [Salinibacterium sp. SWN167]MBH0084231.1 O-methyltransferase [Salinibacterium sp. SWN167]
MSDKQLSWKYAEEFVIEPPEIAAARVHSSELGIEAVSPAVGAQLALLAAATGAKSIIEVGTGVGISGLWMLAGSPGALLTTIDSEIDHQQVARSVFAEAGIQANRVRQIGGKAAEVLPRMNESSYDLVFIDADPQSVIEYVEHGLRLVRPGGVVAVAHALWRDRVPDPAQRDATVSNFRSLLKEISQSTAVISSLIPVGDGLLQLTKLSD